MARELLVKVCGMKEEQNILQLLELPIQYIGHIFYKKSARYVGDLVNISMANDIKKTGVFVNSDFAEIMDATERFNLNSIQLHGLEPVELAAALKAKGLEVIKAFGIDEDFDWKQLEPYIGQVDYF